MDTEIVTVSRSAEDFIVDPNTLYIGHNILGFDVPALQTLWKCRFNLNKVIDTLVVSRLLNFRARGGHSLERWGERLGLPKGDFHEFSQYSQEMVDYCIQDCKVTKEVFLKLEKFIYDPQWKDSLRCEHKIATICRQMQDSGFSFDHLKALEIRKELRSKVSKLSEDLTKAFPARARLIREVTPRETKFGTIARNSVPTILGSDLSFFSPNSPFSFIEWVSFNPASPKMVIDRLNEAGWEPFEKTEGYKYAEKELQQLSRLPKAQCDAKHIAEIREKLSNYETYGWRISEENLETLPDNAPMGTRILVKWRMLSKRLQTIEEWFRAFNPQDGKIHGTYNGIGTWTHRMSHSDPNQGNVPSIESKYHSEELKEIAKIYGNAMRSCFSCGPNNRLIGVDADSIQLRILAHYMDDKEFTESLINGKKEDWSDVHCLNAQRLGFIDFKSNRPRAKTFIYAWLLGAGIGKSAKILGCSNSEASEKVGRFIDSYPGLRRLRQEVIPSDASRGYFIGFDGRKIFCDEYHMLSGYLQTGEACIMKHATIDWMEKLDTEKLPYSLVNFVHDEWQTETENRFSLRVGEIQRQAIRDIGKRFTLKCPLEGSIKIGKNWMETH